MRAIQTLTDLLLEWALLLFLIFSIVVRGGKGLEATWMLAVLAVLLTFSHWWTGRTERKRSQTVRPELWIALMLFLLWSLASFLLSTTRNYGLDELLRDASLVLIFLWVAHRTVPSGTSDSFARRFIMVLAVSTVVACAIGTFVYALQPVNRFVGTFFDWRFTTDYWPNAWAEFLLLTWPIVALWSKRFPLWLRLSLLGFVLGALLLSYSRGAFLTFLLQISAWTLLLFIREWRADGFRRFMQFHGLQLIALLAGSTIAALLVFTGVNAVRARYHEVESVSRKATFTASEGSSSISERKDFWEQSFTLSLQRPLFGWGPYSFRFVQPRLQTEVFATSDHPHNVFLKLAMERGWPAMTLFLFAMLWILFPSCAQLMRASSHAQRNDALLSTLQLPVWIAVVGVLAHNLIDYNLQFVGIVLPFWMMLGILSTANIDVPAVVGRTFPTAASSSANAQNAALENTKNVRIFELLIAVLLGIVTVLEGRMLLLSSLGRHAEAAGDPVSALAWYAQARDEIFSRDMHLSRATLYLGQGDATSATAALNDYGTVNSQDARLWILRGNVALSSGDSDTALHDYAIAIALGKYDYLDPLEGTLHILAAHRRRSERSAERDLFLQIHRKFGDALLRNSHFIDLSENVESFRNVGDLLERLYPANAKEVRDLTSKAVSHAEEERTNSSAREPGILW